MSWAAHSIPEHEEQEQPAIEIYNPARQKFFPKIQPEPRAPDGMLTRLCEEGAHFCTRCIKYQFEHRVCGKCGQPMKWIPAIF